MIYWHVEKNAAASLTIKSISSSEVSAMIEGVLRHCTEMSVQKIMWILMAKVKLVLPSRTFLDFL